MPTPFEIDTEIVRVAEAAGYTEVERRQRVVVDRRLLPAPYWTKAPDYRKIRHDLHAGVEIPGAHLSDVYEYSLKTKGDECQS